MVSQRFVNVGQAFLASTCYMSEGLMDFHILIAVDGVYLTSWNFFYLSRDFEERNHPSSKIVQFEVKMITREAAIPHPKHISFSY